MASTRRTPTWAKPKVRSCTWTPSVLMDGEAALIPTPGTVSPARQAWRVNHPSRYRSPFVVLCLLQVGADVDRYDPLCPQSALSSHLGRPLRSGSGRSTFGNLDLAWSRDWAPVSGHWRGPAIDPVRTSARTDRLPESGPVPSRRAILNSGRTRLLQATTGSDLTIPDLRRAPQSMRPAPWQLKHLRTTAPQQGRGPVTFAATALRRAKVAALAN